MYGSEGGADDTSEYSEGASAAPSETAASEPAHADAQLQRRKRQLPPRFIDDHSPNEAEEAPRRPSGKRKAKATPRPLDQPPPPKKPKVEPSQLPPLQSSEEAAELNGSKRRPWMPPEDDMLRQLVEKYGVKEWAVIGKFITNRNGKQCRERWRNHLRPQLNKSEWSVEEDVQIWSLVETVGTKWAQISEQYMPLRTDNDIKNRWNSILRKQYHPSGRPWAPAERQLRDEVLSYGPNTYSPQRPKPPPPQPPPEVESDGLAQLAFLASNEIDSQYGGDYVGAVGGQLGGGALIRAPNDRRKPLKLQPAAERRAERSLAHDLSAHEDIDAIEACDGASVDVSTDCGDAPDPA